MQISGSTFCLIRASLIAFSENLLSPAEINDIDNANIKRTMQLQNQLLI